VIALKVLGEQDDVISPAFGCVVFAIGVLASRDVCFDSDDRLDAAAFHVVVERHCAVEIAMVGDGDGSGSGFGGALGEGLDLYRAIKEAEIGVKMKVDEVFFVHVGLRSYGLSVESMLPPV
jgi:hypothetical protein